MQPDPIVEEVRKARDEYAKRFNYDLDAICRDLQEKQRRGKRNVISLPPKRPRKMNGSGENIPEDEETMELKVVVHQAEEGGYWAEVPAIPGCATQGESFEELLTNLYEAIEGCLSVETEGVAVEAESKPQSRKERTWNIQPS